MKSIEKLRTSSKQDKKTIYQRVYSSEQKKYGVKIKGHKEWWMEPFFDVPSSSSPENEISSGWFKSDGKYGYVDIESQKIVIPAEYGFPIYFNNHNYFDEAQHRYAEAWKNHKAGVINEKNEVVVPIIYDEVHARYERVDFPEEEKRLVTLEDGTQKRVGPNPSTSSGHRFKDIFRGYACFTNEGGKQAYDEYGQPCEFQEWEQDRLNYEYDWNIPENEHRTVAEMEEIICKEYIKLLEMGYHEKEHWSFSNEHSDAMNKQHELVADMLVDRCHKLNVSWIHNEENARRVARMNNLLMKAVEKAVRLGKKTAKSLYWMEKVSNQYTYNVAVKVSPVWQDERSQYDYAPQEKSKSKEEDRLIEQEDNVSPVHIWNIIRDIGTGFGGSLPLWEHSSYESTQRWNFKELILDDGQSWDECIHFPAYQDVYFTVPFHHLYCDFFHYAMEDLVNMNDFRVDVNVTLQTKEQSRK